jgi:hypothetical protein
LVDKNKGQNNVSQTGNQSYVFVRGAQQEQSAHAKQATGGHPDHKNNKHTKWGELGLESKCMILLTFGILLVGGVTAVILSGQLSTMSEQTNQSYRQAQTENTGAMHDAVRNSIEVRASQDQAKAAQDSAKAIQHQTFQEERPWIALSVSPASNFTYDTNNGALIWLKFTLMNDGHSLAQYTSVWTDIALNGKWPESQKRICGIPKAATNAKSDYGYLLFPGQSVTDSIPAVARSNVVKQALATTPFQGGGVISADVVVCVDYKSAIDSQHHQTRIVRGMTYADAEGRLMGAFAPSRTYQIMLVPHLHGDSAD